MNVTEKTRLHRVEDANKVLGGVTTGLSDYFNIDRTLIRVIFVLLFFTPFPIFIAYVIFWIVLPVSSGSAFNNQEINPYNEYQEINKPTKITQEMSTKQKNDKFVGGIILIAVGTIFAFKTFFNIDVFHFIGKLWPLIPIGIGLWLILKGKEENDNNDHLNPPNNQTLPPDNNSDIGSTMY